MDLIVGLHSIVEALENPKRARFEITTSPETLRVLKQKISQSKLDQLGAQVNVYKPELVQEHAQREYEELGFKYSRVPSAIFLKCDEIKREGIIKLYQDLDNNKNPKVIAIDKVTDVHNLGAIVRSAAFFGIEYLMYSRKDAYKFPPSFYRIASGGAEHVELINLASLPKTLNKLKSMGVNLVGFSEHADTEFSSLKEQSCLIFGAEDEGLSNAVERLLDQRVSLKPAGSIKSLNVSVAVAVGLQKFLG